MLEMGSHLLTVNPRYKINHKDFAVTVGFITVLSTCSDIRNLC